MIATDFRLKPQRGFCGSPFMNSMTSCELISRPIRAFRSSSTAGVVVAVAPPPQHLPPPELQPPEPQPAAGTVNDGFPAKAST
jgi:hypothetical protein